MQTFEEFLKDKFTPDGTLDDDMPDAFDNWLGDLDGEQYIEYADLYGHLCALRAKEELLKELKLK